MAGEVPQTFFVDLWIGDLSDVTLLQPSAAVLVIFHWYPTAVLIQLRCSRSFYDGGDGLEENFNIQQQGPLVNVLQIKLHPFFEGQGAPPIDLPQACNARADAESSAMPVFIEFMKVAHGKGTRPHQAHVALHDIDKLWKFIKTCFAKNSPNASNSWIIRNLEGRTLNFIQVFKLRLLLIGIRHHGAKLQAGESSFIQANSFLYEKHWAR